MLGRFGDIGRARCVVLVCALTSTVVKLRLAATTAGTNDIIHWRDFAAGVHGLGPIDIYSTHFLTPYNHPPLIGWFLVAVNAIASHGPSARFLLRVPASLADVVTTVLVFELVRLRRSLTEATAAAAILSVSPILITVSGFHGNTDPVFVMFIVLSAYLVMRDRPFWAGVSGAIAISIKLVPVVSIPVIAVVLYRDRRRLIAATVGFFATLLPLWGPVVFRQWTGFKRNVLDYNGMEPRETKWGIVDLARHLHNARLVDVMVGPGRFVALGISALVPALLVRKRPDALAEGLGLSLALFLLLTTTFGTQYLAWAAAAVLILDVWGGAAYNATAGVLIVVTYTHWTNGFPWNQAFAVPFNRSEEHLGWLAWTVLLACVVLGIRRLWRWPQTPGRAGLDELTIMQALSGG